MKLKFNLKHKQTLLIGIGVSIIILILLIAFVIVPAVKGYSMYKQMKKAGYTFEEFGTEIDSLNLELDSTHNNLTLCITANGNLAQQAKTAIKEKADAETEIKSLQDQMQVQENKLKSDMADLREYYEEKEQECSDIEDDYDDFVGYMANNYCCKQKVDDSGIDSYQIEDNRVKCSKGGGEQLSC